VKRYLAITTAALVLIASRASAEPPFRLLGFHTDLTHVAALKQARSLGGHCKTATLRSRPGGLLAECDYPVCEADAPDGCATMNDPNSPAATIAIAGQPVFRITLEAARESARLRRVMFSYRGDTATIARQFTDSFGPATVDQMTGEIKSWSRSRRMSWEAGPYRMGLLYRPDVVTLTIDPAQREQAQVHAQ
jgi:hypothetical protein